MGTFHAVRPFSLGYTPPLHWDTHKVTFEITSYAVISAIGAAIAVLVAWLSWLRRDTPGGKSLCALLAAAAIWSFGSALEHATVGIPGQVIWSKFEYIGSESCPVLLLIFALEYNNMLRWLTRRNIALLFTIPTITFLLALTNEWHHLIWTSFTPSPAGSNLTIYGHGPAFWIGATGYSYLMMLVGTILIIRGAVGLPDAYRRQIALILVAALLPWVVNGIYITGFSPIPGLELTPFIVIFSGSIFAWAIYRFNLLDLVPIARHMLIETMEEGMLVLDQHNRIVDFNPAAQKLLGDRVGIKIGKFVSEIFAPWPELNTIFMDDNPRQRTEFTFGGEHGGFIEISLAPVLDWRGQLAGQFVILRDITDKRRIQDALQQANENLRVKLAEVESLQSTLNERAIRDSLTGLYNRRYLDETLERELARAQRESYQISVLMIDIDHFKLLNDTCGHKAGDIFLKFVAGFLEEHVRQGDIICRYGGEEFLIIMPTVHKPDAQKRAEMLCAEFDRISVKYETIDLHSTISIGVATYPKDGISADEVIGAADAAMYAAKEAGRNTVRVR